MSERIGVYICHCGTNISHTVDTAALAEYAKTLPDVAVVREYKYMCSDPGQEMIKKDIVADNLTRVVVSSCSPLMHEETFRVACEDAGLNRFLFQMSNIREQCSWVHEDKARATEKAKRLITAAVRRVHHHRPMEQRSVPVRPEALVVGGGIAGIEAALRIADSGKKVWLVEREPSIGGHMAKFDKTFPTLDCAACILTPKMVQVGKHPNIKILSYSEVEAVSGYVGDFKVKVRRKATSVDPVKCVGCGVCWEKCPQKKIPSEFEVGMSARTAIYTPFAQAVPNKPVIDRANCTFFKTGKCGICKKVCPAGAIDYEIKDEILELNVGAIVIATGFSLFDPAGVPRYGHGRLKDVYSSLEFERLCHASGPTGGKIQTRGGKPPKAVAILHCIGSRDDNHLTYCSRVCCMYSLKFAHLVKEKTGAEVYNLYIDIRAAGKGYEEFYRRLLHEGVQFIRGKAAEVTDVAESPDEKGKLVVVCEDNLLGLTRRLPVDMVILSTGLKPAVGADKVGQTFSLSCSQGTFVLEKHPKLAPIDTASDGIYLAGACQGPKDIPDSVAQGGAAAAAAISLMDRGKFVLEPVTATIDEKLCGACKLCISNCPYAAITFDVQKNVSSVARELCKGCGTCVAGCPSGAATQENFEDVQVFAEIAGVLTNV
jgi:heterodisulfide reductase subunit A2